MCFFFRSLENKQPRWGKGGSHGVLVSIVSLVEGKGVGGWMLVGGRGGCCGARKAFLVGSVLIVA